jgi:membrane-associated progesterone receptor component
MSLSSTPPAQLALYAVLLALPLAAFAARRFSTPTAAQPIATTKEEEPKSIMQPARDDLAPPLDTPYTRAELSAFDGSDPSKPIYVAIKGPFPPSLSCTRAKQA